MCDISLNKSIPKQIKLSKEFYSIAQIVEFGMYKLKLMQLLVFIYFFSHIFSYLFALFSSIFYFKCYFESAIVLFFSSNCNISIAMIIFTLRGNIFPLQWNVNVHLYFCFRKKVSFKDSKKNGSEFHCFVLFCYLFVCCCWFSFFFLQIFLIFVIDLWHFFFMFLQFWTSLDLIIVCFFFCYDFHLP